MLIFHIYPRLSSSYVSAQCCSMLVYHLGNAGRVSCHFALPTSSSGPLVKHLCTTQGCGATCKSGCCLAIITLWCRDVMIRRLQSFGHTLRSTRAKRLFSSWTLLVGGYWMLEFAFGAFERLCCSGEMRSNMHVWLSGGDCSAGAYMCIYLIPFVFSG